VLTGVILNNIVTAIGEIYGTNLRKNRERNTSVSVY